MSVSNRAATLGKIHRILKKYYKPVSPPADRSVLDTLLYGCCLEDARYEAADEAFAKLQELYFDWNEIRVTTFTELAETLSALPSPQQAAQRLRKTLQGVYEQYYSLDLEPLKKQNQGKTLKDLEKIQGMTPFILGYVTQNALAGHSIAVDRAAAEVLFASGAVNDTEADRMECPGLERAIPKNKGVEFFSLLHQFSADFFASPASNKLRGILAEIDSESKERLTHRTTRAAELAAQAAQKPAPKPAPIAPVPTKDSKTKPEKGDKSEKSDKAEKSAGTNKPAAKETSKPKASEKAEKPKPTEKTKGGKPEKKEVRPVAKGLAKKKPR
jgi:endonuclease III